MRQNNNISKYENFKGSTDSRKWLSRWPEHSISSVLGFNNDLYTTDYQESENSVNLLSVNSILVNIDIISGSYVNGQRYSTIYSFFRGVSPGHKIIETPANLVYLPVTLDAIYSMQTSLTDQNGKLLNLRGALPM